MRKYLIIVLFFAFWAGAAQEIDFKKDQVLVDNVVKFDFYRRNASTLFSLYKLGTKDEIIFMSFDNGGTSSYDGDDFRKIAFLGKDVTVRAKTFRGYTWKRILKLLIEEKVLDLDGNIDEGHLKIFAEKYDDTK